MYKGWNHYYSGAGYGKGGKKGTKGGWHSGGYYGYGKGTNGGWFGGKGSKGSKGALVSRFCCCCCIFWDMCVVVLVFIYS